MIIILDIVLLWYMKYECAWRCMCHLTCSRNCREIKLVYGTVCHGMSWVAHCHPVPQVIQRICDHSITDSSLCTYRSGRDRRTMPAHRQCRNTSWQPLQPAWLMPRARFMGAITPFPCIMPPCLLAGDGRSGLSTPCNLDTMPQCPLCRWVHCTEQHRSHNDPANECWSTSLASWVMRRHDTGDM